MTETDWYELTIVKIKGNNVAGRYPLRVHQYELESMINAMEVDDVVQLRRVEKNAG